MNETATVSYNENVGDDQLKHPEVITTLEQMDAAPTGTIIADRVTTIQKIGNDEGCGLWMQMNRFGSFPSTLYYEKGRIFRVLRWGKGDEH